MDGWLVYTGAQYSVWIYTVVLILDTFIVIKVVLKNRLKKEVNELFRLSYSLTMAERI